MYHALDLGIGVEEFWDMTPRAICILVQEMAASGKAANQPARRAGKGAAPRVVKLDHIPRP